MLFQILKIILDAAAENFTEKTFLALGSGQEEKHFLKDLFSNYKNKWKDDLKSAFNFKQHILNLPDKAKQQLNLFLNRATSGYYLQFNRTLKEKFKNADKLKEARQTYIEQFNQMVKDRLRRKFKTFSDPYKVVQAVINQPDAMPMNVFIAMSSEAITGGIFIATVRDTSREFSDQIEGYTKLFYRTNPNKAYNYWDINYTLFNKMANAVKTPGVNNGAYSVYLATKGANKRKGRLTKSYIKRQIIHQQERQEKADKENNRYKVLKRIPQELPAYAQVKKRKTNNNKNKQIKK